MTCTTADALEVMACVAACHPRTAPRWHDDPESTRFTAETWAKMFSRHNLSLPDLLAAVQNRAADTADTAPEPGEIIQVARAIRRDRTDREMCTRDGQHARAALIDAKVAELVAPAVLAVGRLDKPATGPASAARRAVDDADRTADARAELDAIRDRV